MKRDLIKKRGIDRVTNLLINWQAGGWNTRGRPTKRWFREGLIIWLRKISGKIFLNKVKKKTVPEKPKLQKKKTFHVGNKV